MSSHLYKFNSVTDLYERVAQPAHGDQGSVTLTSDATALAALTVDDPPTQDQVVALRNATAAVATDVANLITLANRLRTDLVTVGIIKGDV